MKPLVSVIIPMYNAAPFIRQTIRSVQDQTVTDWEIIVMNDGSKDNSEEVVKEMMQEDSRIRYQYKANSGVSDTRNKGIALCNGEYIAFLDADDVWLPQNLEKKIAAITSSGKAWAFSLHESIDEQNKQLEVKFVNFKPYNVVDNLLLWEGDVVPGPCSNIVVRRDFIGEDIRFDKSLSSPADRDICLQLGTKGEPVFVDEKLWQYRLHSQSMTSVNFKVVDEMVRLYKKADEKGWFSSPRLRRKAMSNVSLILAGICYRFPTQRKRMAGFLLKSIWYSPFNIIKKKVVPLFKKNKSK
ncbi:MAG: glycosyltransferase family 2 protein [Chitinophagaceae bacterium]|nr:glycosyltransferase family 2 protein [Chitinophagaceae bacterium]